MSASEQHPPAAAAAKKTALPGPGTAARARKRAASTPAPGTADGMGMPDRPPVKENRFRQNAPYIPGQYDHLLSPRPPAPAAPGDLHAVLIGVSASGLSIIASEQRSDGRVIKHLVSEFPYYVDILLPDGRSVQVEARMFDPQPVDPEEVEIRKRRKTGGNRQSAVASAPVLVLGMLHSFGSDAGGYLEQPGQEGDC